MVGNSKPSIQIDLNEFKLHLQLKGRPQFTLHFNSPSRSFYLSVIALAVNEMKKSGRIKSIPLQEHVDLLALLNETIGGAAGSSEKENLLHRIYTKWRDALPNLEDAPLFKVEGKKKKVEGDGAIGRVYSFTDAEMDGWANLFDYMGSEENVRLKFALDKIGVGLNETSIIFGDYRNGEAWDQFIASLKKGEKKEEEKEEEKEESALTEETVAPEPTVAPISPPQERKISWFPRYRWVLLAVVIGIVAVGIWKIFLAPAPIEVASVDRMKYPLPDKPSIAVLPFVNLSNDPEQEYFSDGMADDLITDLSKISDLLVIARNSTFSYKGKSAKIKQVAEELGVRYVLEGSVRRAGDEIRINAQLIDAMTGHHVWADRYDGSMKDVFALQDRITQKVVSALAVKLTGAEKQSLADKGTNNVEAYDEFLGGWVHYLRMDLENLAKAVQSYKKAIELDPSYGRAYAGLALAYWTGTTYPGWYKALGVSWLEGRLRVKQFLKQATGNPTSISHRVNAEIYLWRRQHEKAIFEYERGLALDPNDPACNVGMGTALFFGGKPKEAIAFINRAMRLDPQNPAIYLQELGGAQFCMGNLKEAEILIEKVRRINPALTPPWLASIHGLLGHEKEARFALDTFLKKAPGIDLPLTMYFMPFKDQSVADRLAEGLIKAGIKAPPWRYFPAFKENQLTGEEIKKLLFGAKATGIRRQDGQQWWIDRKKNGEFTWRGPSSIFVSPIDKIPGPYSDNGKSWVDGDLICDQFHERLWGLETCGTIFRNPGGTYESKDEYLACQEWSLFSFSVMR